MYFLLKLKRFLIYSMFYEITVIYYYCRYVKLILT